MTGPVKDLSAMLTGMQPVLSDAPFRFVAQNRADGAIASFDHTFAVIREGDGTTFIVLSADADGHDGPDFAKITLQVHSALEGVGLTAAVAAALAQSNIACNVVAGFHHDHIFVPWEYRTQAIAILKQLSQDARR